MTIIEIIKKRIYENSDAPADLSGLFVAVDKPGNPKALRLDIARMVASQVGEVVGDSIVKFDHHRHFVTPAEATGGDFSFDVPNVIVPTMGIHVYCNQLPLTYDKGYSFDIAPNANTKTVTIHKNNSDETYYSIKAGWPIFVGYYYKIAIPGTIPESMVTLDSITHQAPNNPTLEYDSQNNVKFILHFNNTGSATESLNLKLTLVHSGSGGVVAENNITHAIPAGGNTYEITYLALGNTSGTNTYTLYVTGDKTGNDAVTVPAKTATFTVQIMDASRNTTTSIFTSAKVINTGSITGSKTIYFQLDTGTKYPKTAYLAGNNWEYISYEYTGVNTAAHTVNIYDSDQTSLIGTWPVAALAGPTETIFSVVPGTNIDVYHTQYTTTNVFNHAWTSLSGNDSYIKTGENENLVSRIGWTLYGIPNSADIDFVRLRCVLRADSFANLNDAWLSHLQAHVPTVDYKVYSNFDQRFFSFTNNNIIVSTEVIQAINSQFGVKEYVITLYGSYFENITTGYKNILFKMATESDEFLSLWCKKIELIN